MQLTASTREILKNWGYSFVYDDTRGRCGCIIVLAPAGSMLRNRIFSY